MVRQKRNLSPEERQLWDWATREVLPLKRSAPRLKPGRAKIEPPAPPAALKPRIVQALKLEPARAGKAIVKPLVPPLAGIEPGIRKRLDRGRRSFDAVLDLHGLRQSEAHGALAAFITQAHAVGHRVVLVITGKGARARPGDEGGPSATGLIRRAVPGWLGDARLRDCIIGFEEAGLRQGGAGALYVRIRRKAGERY